MGRIICQAKIENAVNEHEGFEFSALVDTGTSHLTLPSAWKSRLGEFQDIQPVKLETANQCVDILGHRLVHIKYLDLK